MIEPTEDVSLSLPEFLYSLGCLLVLSVPTIIIIAIMLLVNQIK